MDGKRVSSGQYPRCVNSLFCMERFSAAESDAVLVQRVRDGDTNAFEYIVERYRDRVFEIVAGSVPPEQVEEMSHEAFVRAFLSLSSFRGEGELGAWISRIAVRTCLDFWRKRYRDRERVESSLTEEELQWLEKTVADRSDAEISAEQSAKWAKSFLEKGLERLSAKDRMVLQLVHIEELSIKEAASLLGCSTVSVKVRALRARRKLRAFLKEILRERKGSAGK